MNKERLKVGNFGGCDSRDIDFELLKISANPEKYIVPGICNRDTEKRVFAKQMGK